MEPALCRECGSLNFRRRVEIVPEIIEWRCDCGLPVYWHAREAREVSLREIKTLEREAHG